MKKTAFLLKVFFTIAILTTILAVSVSAAALGDIDADGKVTAGDARLALRASVGLEKYVINSAPFTAGDVDADGKITAADARLILRAAVGLEKLVPVHVHSFGAWTAEKNAKGIATGNHVRTCACGEKETAACSFGAKVYTSSNKTPTCTQGTTYYTECSVCKYRKGGAEAKLGHKKGTLISGKSKAATCTTAGTNCYSCSVCQAEFSESVAALGHAPNISAATCTQDKICTRCKTVLERKHHVPGPTATCLENQVCTVCKQVLASAKGHDKSGKAATCTTDQICPKCGEVADYAHHTDKNGDYICDICTADMKVDRFNDRVNVLKDGTHKAVGFTRTENKQVIKDKDFKYSAAFKAFMLLLPKEDRESMPSEEEMLNDLAMAFTADDTSNSLFALAPKALTKDSFIIKGNEKVSCLVNADVSDIKEETVTGIDFLSELPDSVKMDAGVKFDLTTFKNAEIGDVIKTTVTVKQEKYSAVRSLKNPTALMRITNTDIRALINGLAAESTDLSSLGVDGTDGFNANVTFDCKEALSDATVIYYFDAATKAPIAAKYKTLITVPESKFTFSLGLLSDNMLNGHINFSTTTTTESYYFFDGYFN